MAIGMTYEQYWYDDPLIVRAFYKAEKIRQTRLDEQAWMQGLYFQRALDSIVGNMFREKGAKPAEYPDRPLLYEFKPKKAEKVEKKQTVEIEEQEALWAKAWMTNFVQAGKNWGKK